MAKYNVAYLAWLGTNYGSTLQSYALYRSIIKMGYGCEVIDSDSFVKDNEPSPMLKESDPKKYDSSLTRYTFDVFIHKHFVLNKNLRSIPNDLLLDKSQQEAIKNFDAFLCGSDQIWKPAGFWFRPKQYLQFVPVLKRIGYAPSIGWKTVPAAFHHNILQWKKWLSTVPYLSTREMSGSVLISEVTGRPVATVVDPTMLLKPQEWLMFMAEPRYSPVIAKELDSNKPYLLAYFLDRRKMFEKTVESLAKRLKLRIIWLSGRWNSGQVQDNCAETDPAGFVNLISKASFVCADGFHGICFALNFSKPLAFFSPHRDLQKSNDARVEDLFSRLGVDPKKHIVTPLVPPSRITTNFNYDEIQKRITEERDFSLNYLENALLGATQSQGILFHDVKECGAFKECFPEDHYSGKAVLKGKVLKFECRDSGAEIHTIRRHSVVVPVSEGGAIKKDLNESKELPVIAPLGIELRKGCFCEIHLKVMLLTSASKFSIYLYSSMTGKKYSLCTISKAMMGWERWHDLYVKICVKDESYDSIMMDASELTGYGAYASFDAVDITGKE